MEKKSIFKKIDDMYTKATKIIIGDIPHDGDAPQEKTTNIEKVKLKNKMISLKERFLTLGTPDQQSMSYQEVVKKEKQVLKNTTTLSKKTEKQKNETNKKKSIVTKPTTTSKKSPSQKTIIKKTASSTQIKKGPGDKEAAENKTTTIVKKNTLKKTSIKKPATKQTKNKSTQAKEISTKKTTLKAQAKKEPIKNKKTTSSKTVTSKIAITSQESKDIEKKSKVKNGKDPILKDKPVQRGAKKAAKIALYIKDIKKHYGDVDEKFLAIIVKNLGPSIYKKDAELVSCSDSKELDTVRTSFLKKKLGIDASKGVLDAAIQDVCTELKGTRNKYRATFYYALAKKFKKESVLN